MLACETAQAGFHARFDARGKRYAYRLANVPVQSPFDRPYAWHIPSPRLDGVAMNAAAALLEGEHDFAAFQTVGGAPGPTDREIFSSRIAADTDGLIVYEVTGDGFLRHMVRAIVGTLVEVGRGRQPPDWMREIGRAHV